MVEPIITTELCYYGCGQIAVFLNASGHLMCSDRSSKCPAVKAKNSAGVSQAHKNGKLHEFTAEQRSKSRRGKRFAVFGIPGNGDHKNTLLLERGHKCEGCGLTEWKNQPIVIELEHSDGDRSNNTRENLKLLCPNCHSLTPTWRGRNLKFKRIKFISDNDLILALRSSKSIHQALIKVGLTPKSTNYARCYDLLYQKVT